ncbi:hypothetical protein GF337_05905, partial [candidate division KSB1 bacterium]|nr:hypothetical protein [candidate division KSB1 bacterium]
MIDEMARLNMSYLLELLRDEKNIHRDMELMNKFLRERNCTFRGQVMPTLLKPNFLSPRQSTVLKRVVKIISNVLNKFIKYYFENEDVRKIMNFSAEENELFSIDPGYSVPLVISRLDAFMQDYDIRFLEFNCDSPAGTAYSDVLEDGFHNYLEKYNFLIHWKIKYSNRQDQLLNALLACYREFSSQQQKKKNPTIAIIDWEDVSTLSEFELLKVYFESKGYPTIISCPQKLKIRNGELTVDGEVIDIIYRRVITRELIKRMDEVNDFIQAVKDGLVCMANPFRSFIVGNKKVLAIMTDPAFQSIYSREELKIINQCIPWTKVLKDSKETFQNFQVNLRNFIYDNRENLVLKPASSYGGKDVYLGRDTTDDTWRRIVDENIDNENWVVQQYVPIPEDIFPELRGDEIHLKLKKVNI